MYVNLSLTFTAIFFFVHCKSDSESSTAGGFRTTKTGPKPLWSETTLDKLKKDLLMNYDKYARPKQHYNTTEVKIGLVVTYLETNELKSTVTLHAWLRLIWNDSKLKWNESDYGGLSVARIADHEIWQPDLYLYNSASGGEPITRFGNPNVLIYPNGEVIWVPPTKLTALCQFNLRRWPFDTQHCYFKFGSWTHNGNEIKLELYNNQNSAELETTLAFSTWNISNSTAEVQAKFYDCCPEPYYSVQFNFTLVRKSAPYKAVIVTPAVVIALLILMQFWLPPQAEEKLILNGFIVVTIVMFLLYFTNQISAAGCDTPLIVLFYSSSLYMLCFSMVGTIAALSLSKIKRTQSLPWSIRKHLQGNLGKWLLLECTFREVSTIDHSFENLKPKASQVSEFEGRSSDGYNMTKFNSEKPNQQDWILALAVDRLLFIIYSIVLLIVFIIYLL